MKDEATPQRVAAVTSDAAVIGKDLGGTIISWNATAERMFGYTEAEALGRSIRIVVTPQRFAEQDSVLRQVGAGEPVDRYETVWRRKDGSLVDVSLTVSPVPGDNGAAAGFTTVAQEILDPALLEREALRLAAIVESSDDAIISKDLTGVIQTWNSGAQRMFGYTASEAVGRHITMIIPEERLDEETEVLRRIRRGESVDHFETVRRTKDGRLVDISLTVSPIRRRNGVIIGASKIARDISEQRRLRAEAEEANRLKDEFLATLSHELRTPLNTVVGYITMLRRGMMDPEQQARAIEVIRRNADTLTDLVNELLDMSRIVTGKIRLNVRLTDLSAVVREGLENVKPSLEAKRLTLETTLAPDVLVSGDADRLQQIMWNLLTNAVKFTPPGGRLGVRLSAENGFAVISVRDSGVGLTPESLRLLFQRFWQAESVRSRDHGGLGLGLALARHFVELHGGTIQAMSDGLDKGTEFRVELPLAL